MVKSYKSKCILKQRWLQGKDVVQDEGLSWCHVEYSSMYSYHQHYMKVSDQLLTLAPWAPGTK